MATGGGVWVALRGEEEKSQGINVSVFPTYPRYMIPTRQYLLWYGVFLFFNVLFFVLLAKALEGNTGPSSEIKFPSYYLAYPSLLSALLISGLLPGLPAQVNILSMLRSATHRKAMIPDRSLQILTHMKNNRLYPTSKDKQNTIKKVGGDCLDIQYFDQKVGSIELNWAYTCYLLYKISAWTFELNNDFAKHIGKRELEYERINKNFQILQEDMRHYRQNNGNSTLISRHTKDIFSQVAQLVICLVFRSVPVDDEADKKFVELGLVMVPHIKQKMKIEFLFGSAVLFFAIVLLAAFSVGCLLHANGIYGEKIDGSYAFNCAWAGLIVLFGPIVITYFVKAAWPEYWPFRGEFSNTHTAQIFIVAILGGIVGIGGFFLIKGPLHFEDGWETSRLPYAILSALTGLFAGLSLDRKPRIWKLGSAGVRSLGWGVLQATLFLLATLSIIVVVKNAEANSTTGFLAFLEKEKLALIIIPLIGLVIGFMLFLSGQYSISVNEATDLLKINVAQYFIPVIETKNIMEGEVQRINELILERKAKFQRGFLDYMREENLLNDDNALVENALERIRNLYR